MNISIRYLNIKSLFYLISVIFLMVRKAPFSFGIGDPIAFVLYVKFFIAIWVYIDSRLHKFSLATIVMFMLGFLISWSIDGNEALKIFFEILYIIIISLYLYEAEEMAAKSKTTFFIFTSILMLVVLSGLDFSSPGSGPGKYYLWGPTTAVRCYAFVLFLGFYLLLNKYNNFQYAIISLASVLLAYVLFVAVSKASWIAISMLFPILIWGAKYNKKYVLICVILISGALLSVLSGAGEVVVNRFLQAAELTKFIGTGQSAGTGINVDKNVLLLEASENLFRLEQELRLIDKTGRVNMYEESVRLIKTRPLTGYLFHPTGSNLIFFDKSNGHPHNLIIEISLRFGILFLIIIVITTILKFKKIWKELDISKKTLMASVVLYFSILSMFGGDIVDNLYWIVLIQLIRDGNSDKVES